MRVDGAGMPHQPAGGAARSTAVLQGERSIGDVARRLGVDEKALAAANPHFEGGRVSQGQEVRLPDHLEGRAAARAATEGQSVVDHGQGKAAEAEPKAEKTAAQARADEGRYTSKDDKMVGLDLRGRRVADNNPVADTGPVHGAQHRRGAASDGQAAAAADHGPRKPAGRADGDTGRSQRPKPAATGPDATRTSDPGTRRD